MRAALRGAIALASLALASLAVAAAALAGTGPQRVGPAGIVVVDVRGFAPGAGVVLHLAGRAGQLRLHADAEGRARTRFRAPRAAGAYRLLVVGPITDTGAPTVNAGPVSATRDPQNIDVIVPRVAAVPFVVVAHPGRPGTSNSGAHPSGGVEGAADSTSAAAGRHSEQAGALSATGSDLSLPLLVGAGAVGAGGTLLLVGRARRPANGRHR